MMESEPRPGQEQECGKRDHSFTVMRADYFKESGRSNALGPIYDQSASYSMLYCTKCGDTKEVVSGDHVGLSES